MDNKPFTPETLAARWGCSGRHIRALIARGELPSFRLGKLIRIPADAVAEIEGCSAVGSGEAGTPVGISTASKTHKAQSPDFPKVVATYGFKKPPP